VIWTPATGYEATAVYVARIGGILYRNVLQPIVYYDHSLITFSRNSDTNRLSALAS
jgi:hypothetical protein